MAMEKFHHTLEDGTVITLPKFKFVPAGVIRRTRTSNQADQIFSAIEAVASDETVKQIDELTSEQLNDFIKAWQKNSGVTMGESSASSSS